MPKQKTHSGAKKRFKVTGSGKLRRQQSSMRHNFERKPSTLTRRLSMDKDVSAADRKTIKRMLGL
ncbi:MULTISPECIES: 50S ribosomal protein L35 [unclassified Tersicoccus]|uniref:50S ribosomal protein L35 n=1 Tax=Tersicoccus TaxID=1418588 RepID=UPI000975DB66|nr:50S ribosomal protein L35 [Tersicoccus sp. Bi-70]OMH31168.1 50S ribosomal protein L35 [Tersicoccus sp. Bi-70]